MSSPTWADVVNGSVRKYATSNSGKAKGDWLPVVAVVPYHNPVTEFLSGPAINTGTTGVVLTYTVNAKENALESMQEHITNEATKLFQEKISGVTAGYAPEEVTSWAQQRKESEEYLLDNTVSTPLIDSIVLQRGLSKSVVVDFINTNAIKYASAVGFYLGRKQAIWDLTYDASVTMADLETIVEDELEEGWVIPVA